MWFQGPFLALGPYYSFGRETFVLASARPERCFRNQLILPANELLTGLKAPVTRKTGSTFEAPFWGT